MAPNYSGAWGRTEASGGGGGTALCRFNGFGTAPAIGVGKKENRVLKKGGGMSSFELKIIGAGGGTCRGTFVEHRS